MRTFFVVIKPSVAKRGNYSTDVLTITSKDFYDVINGKLMVQVKGANAQYPNNYVDFNIDELIFI
jgi:hypothetical protein